MFIIYRSNLTESIKNLESLIVNFDNITKQDLENLLKKLKSNKTNFQKIKEFHDTSGLDNNDTPQLDVFDNKSLVKLRLDLIAEEFQELNDAIKDRNFVEVLDALTDILYVVYGAGASFGLDLDKSYEAVHKSNMSKFCKTEKEAKDTVKWYKENDDRYDSPSYNLSDDGEYYIIVNQSTGKILKSINYTPVTNDLKKLIDL